MTTLEDIDASLAGLVRIKDDVYETVEARKAARKRIDDELDRRNRVRGTDRNN